MKKTKKQPKERRAVRYFSLKQESAAGKALLKEETERALIYRFLADNKDGATFPELLEFLKASFPSKSQKTLRQNGRWYLSNMRKGGLVKGGAR